MSSLHCPLLGFALGLLGHIYALLFPVIGIAPRRTVEWTITTVDSRRAEGLPWFDRHQGGERGI